MRRTPVGRHAQTMSTDDTASAIDIEPVRVADWLAEDPTLQVVDVRQPYEYDAGHIELVEFSSHAATLDRDRPVVFYCRVGTRSQMAARALRAAGFEAYSMAEGLARWAREARPLSPEGGSVAEQ